MLWWRIFCLCQTYQRDKLLPNHIALFVAKSFWAFSLKNYLLQNCDKLFPLGNYLSQKFFNRFHWEIVSRKNSLGVFTWKLFPTKVRHTFAPDLRPTFFQFYIPMFTESFSQKCGRLSGVPKTFLQKCDKLSGANNGFLQIAARFRASPKPSCKTSASFWVLTMASCQSDWGYW